MAKEFKLPNLGEGVAQGEVVAVNVKPGDALVKGEPMLEVETDKAVADVGAPENGTLVSIAVKVGDKVKPGHVIVTYEPGAASAPAAAAVPTKSEKTAPPAASAPKTAAPPVPKTDAAVSAPKVAPNPIALTTAPPEKQGAPAATGGLVAASPGVRKFARELGVDLTSVTGTGGGGRVLESDVKDYVKRVLAGGGANVGAGGAGISQPRMPDFTRWGAVEKIPLKGVRRATAEGMSRNWGLIPHVTQFDVVDITSTEASRKKLADKRKASAQPGKITMTVLAVKAVTKALGEFPQFASSIDMTAGEGELIRKSYRHIGIAVDSPNGLMVPVLRDTDKKGLTELATELEGLAEKVRSRKIALEDMQGSVFTISNLGGIGGTFFTPIVNWPEVAILGISKSRQELQMVDGRVEARLVMGMSLSYDHRVIDGADGARFLKRVGEILSDPFDLLT
jgi:pyruvate dehydrogenase E2 component (dihydrolipoamide acetyltransferase)